MRAFWTLDLLLIVLVGDAIAVSIGRVYWSSELESAFKPPFSARDRDDFISKTREESVVHLETGCGRLKNRLATLSDGTKVCCRYRDSKSALRGELYSYHLANLLGMWNVPPTTVLTIDYSSDQWRTVSQSAKDAGWEDDGDVIMVLYIEGLEQEFVPQLLRGTNQTVTSKILAFGESSETISGENLVSEEEKIRLMQWSDLALFDFIIGHTDRLFNTLVNLQWNKHMYERCINNLLKTSSGQLVLIDNESGLWIGYTMTPDKVSLQKEFLNKMCVFKRSTVQTLTDAYSSIRSAADILEDYVLKSDSKSYKALRKLSGTEKEEFNHRIAQALQHIQHCKATQ